MTAQQRQGRRVTLAAYPDGPIRPTDFSVEAYASPAPADGEFLVATEFVSVDPMLRLFVDGDPLIRSMPPLPLGTTVPGAAVGRVVESRHPDFAVGDIVEGRFGWQDHAVSDGRGVVRVGAALGAPEQALGVGGLPGFTAYVGIGIADVRPGQTVLVSGAAGAVGSVVGALVAARGGRAVGIAGGAEKCRYLVERAGYAVAVDRHAPDFGDRLRAALPDGANVYFDNVGGPLLAGVVGVVARGGLVLICGLMSHYQRGGGDAVDHLPAVLEAVMFNGLRIQSFSQFGQDAQRPAFEAEIGGLIASGALEPQLTVEEGIERLPHALVGLFERSVPGKVVVRLGGKGR